MKYPQVGEFLLATVKKIMPFGAFCALEEYEGREAFMHISEVAPRWIKNIHEFLRDGQKLVVVVTKIDMQKDQVDVSLKKVSEREKTQKQEEVRRQSRAFGIFEAARKESKLTPEKLAEVREKLEEKFGGAHESLQAVVDDPEAYSDLGLPEKFASALIALVKKNIKKPVFEMDRLVELTCYSANGVGEVKQVFSSIADSGIAVIYEGAPRYRLRCKGTDFINLEKSMGGALAALEGEAGKLGCMFVAKPAPKAK